jgi:hypothetical protein
MSTKTTENKNAKQLGRRAKSEAIRLTKRNGKKMPRPNIVTQKI